MTDPDTLLPCPFEREDRYIVIKKNKLTAAQALALRAHMDRFNISPVGCVVVERDWPEYETVWRMIEDRVTRPQPPAPQDGSTKSDAGEAAGEPAASAPPASGTVEDGLVEKLDTLWLQCGPRNKENDVKLWKISWPDYDKPYWYDRYDSAVVTAETEAEARAVHPGEHAVWGSAHWAATPDLVVAEEIGTTDLPAGKVVCASFNAA